VWSAWATVAWNTIEGVIAISAGAVASSVALIGFGIDSFVETASGAVVGWRLRAELTGYADHERAEHMERRAGKITPSPLAIVPLVIREGLEGWRGECHDESS
jgi:hypothetical protein